MKTKFQYDIFISYAEEDQKIVDDLKDKLESDHYVVHAYKHKSGGASSSLVEKIFNNLDQSIILMPIISKNSVKSKWVKKECLRFYDKDKHIVPVITNHTKPFNFLESYEHFDAEDRHFYVNLCKSINEYLSKYMTNVDGLIKAICPYESLRFSGNEIEFRIITLDDFEPILLLYLHNRFRNKNNTISSSDIDKILDRFGKSFSFGFIIFMSEFQIDTKEKPVESHIYVHFLSGFDATSSFYEELRIDVSSVPTNKEKIILLNRAIEIFKSDLYQYTCYISDTARESDDLL
ncbi:MAG: toll/interleukin-1 receptor domain-containing protein [Caldisericales bacterium]|nr:toll/interleukin-1 receptor domain-containing protein [Caldisericales bacterium]